MSGGSESSVEPIAIIGMACRVPGAGDVAQFWRNLADGVESISFFTREEQAALGVPDAELDDPAYVPAAPVLDDMEFFDAGLFGMTPREAEVSDPQQRLFLELAHTALEDAGHDSARFDGLVGVYGGMGSDQYLWNHLLRSRRLAALSGAMTFSIGASPDYLATFVSYKLNLRGPSFTLHTACSTSLVAAHLGCEALRGGECDMALAGGVSIELPNRRGYVHREGGVVSPDGHCRPFDATAGGTVWGSGGGIVVLRRLSDALADGDQVRAVILGSAINNDGSSKVGFTAPSVDGQAEVIALALGMAGVAPRSIGYVEAHGTGTALGDPVEVTALSTVFGRGVDERGWCGLGSVKSNLGHLSQAAGVVGMIKTVLAMEHGMIPPTLHFERPNPAIDLKSSPFRVVASPWAWQRDGGPRRASVSSFGIGGTNAHLVLEEAPPPERPPAERRPAHMLQVSARSEAALDASVRRLADHLVAHPQLDLADVAHTLRAGRGAHAHRAAAVARDAADATDALRDRRRLITGTAGSRRVAFLLSGQGSQHAGMGAELYRLEPVFRRAVDECAGPLVAELGEDLRELLLADGEGRAAADARLRRTALAQPSLFVLEHALAELWRSWGVVPAAAVGHSIGEYVAAELAGVLTLPDALRLVAIRGRLMQGLPAGSMLAVQLDEDEIVRRLPDELAVAAVNGPRACVVSGPADAIERLAGELAAEEVGCRRLRTSHAFHSPMMEPILDEFRAAVAGVERRPPGLPYLSCVTGDWIAEAQTADPAYWARQLRETVRFGDCVRRLHESGAWLLVECGPGRQLTGLARLQAPAGSPPPVPSLPGPDDRTGQLETLAAAAARLWTAGAAVDGGVGGRRVPLPTYPYERRRYFVEADADAVQLAEPSGPLPVERWFSVPTWRSVATLDAADVGRCLAFVAGGHGAELVAALRASGTDVIEVAPGAAPGRDPDGRFVVRPDRAGDYRALLGELAAGAGLPSRIVHAWALAGEPAGTDAEAAWRAQDLGFFGLLWLVQALAGVQLEGAVHLDVLTRGAEDVTGRDLVRPEHATAAALARVVPLELPALTMRTIDVDPADDARCAAAAAAAELRRPPAGDGVALRGGRRWVRDHQPVEVAPPADPMAGLREGGVYLVTGGTGGIGITMAEDLARRARARLVLLARSGLPPRAAWDEHLRAHGAASREGRAIAAIRRAEAAGGEVMVVAADVTSRDDLRRVRAETLARFGRIDGIVHAAGLPGGGMAEVKERAAAEAVLAPKLRGTLALREAFGDLPLDFVVLCSSVTGLAGGLGQVDYCAANAFLDAHARGDHGWRARVVSVDWGAWRDVGMAAEVAVPDALRRLGREERTSAVDHPVFHVRHEPAGGLPSFSGTISPATHWLLDEHRLGGHPLVPGAAYLELARWAFAAAVPGPAGHVVELRDVVFVEPLAVPEGDAAELRLSLTADGDEVRFEVAGARRVHAGGALAWADPGPVPVVDLEAIRERCPTRDGAGASPPASLLTTGPRWRSLRQVGVGRDEQLALLEAPELVAGELDRWPLHPALVDMATAFADPGEGSYLPLGYGRVLARGPLPARLWTHLRYHGRGSGEIVLADVSLLDDRGREVLAIADFVFRRIDPAATTASLGRRPDAEPAPATGGAGISPADGVEALHRLIAAGLRPQVVVCAAPLDRVLAGVRRLDAAAVESELDAAAAAERPQRMAGSDFVAPRTELEARLADVWRDVLGIGEIGVEDDFFELGGNSLVAVQLIARIRTATGVRIPMRALFETATVAGMAALVERLRAEGAVAEPAPIRRLARQGG